MSTPVPDSVAPEALAIAQPLVTWLLRSGVGYGAFSAALKPLFLAQAQQELERSGHKVTDSALSLLSGLHRKEVRALRAKAQAERQGASIPHRKRGKPSLAQQVLTRWQAEAPGDTLALAGPAPSFEALARSVSRDVHPRAVLQELQRLGRVREVDGRLHLQGEALAPGAQDQGARQLLAHAVADHLRAGVHNLTAQGPDKFLAQSVFVDGLSPESVQQLHQLADALWSQALQQLGAATPPMCERDAGNPSPQRFCLGLFSHAALLQGEPETAADRKTSA